MYKHILFFLKCMLLPYCFLFQLLENIQIKNMNMFAFICCLEGNRY